MAYRVLQGVRAGFAGTCVLVGAAGAGLPAGEEPFTERVPGTAVSFEMLPVPAGEVEVADGAGKRAKVTVGPLWVGKTEVTWDEFDVFVYRLDLPEAERAAGQSGGDDPDAVTRPSKPYLPPDRGYGHSGYPAITMSHHAAVKYCEWLSEKTGRRYRLPTEAEWEHAARAGGPEAKAADVAWTAADAGGTTHPVGKKRANAWGMYDTLGNVAEWCTAADGKGVARGGSFLDETVGVASRQAQTPAWNASDPQIPKSRWWLADCNFVGFRVVCEGPAGPEGKNEPAGKAGGGDR